MASSISQALRRLLPDAGSSTVLTAKCTAQALKAAGYDGLDTGELVEAMHESVMEYFKT